ncbi:hypothetical protein SLA2020_488000 [Shorea laevis]
MRCRYAFTIYLYSRCSQPLLRMQLTCLHGTSILHASSHLRRILLHALDDRPLLVLVNGFSIASSGFWSMEFCKWVAISIVMSSTLGALLAERRCGGPPKKLQFHQFQ